MEAASKGGVDGAGAADGQRAHRHAGRHLDDRKRLSRPSRAALSTGTPSTGRVVSEAIMPGRCAAPPAPAMITLTPRALAPAANSTSRSGVRWAETMRAS